MNDFSPNCSTKEISFPGMGSWPRKSSKDRGFSVFDERLRLFPLLLPLPFQTPTYSSGQMIIFHQARFPWNKVISLFQLPFGVRSCDVAILWPDSHGLKMLETCGTSYIYPQEVQRPNGAQGWAGNPVLNHLNHHSLFGLGLGTCPYK